MNNIFLKDETNKNYAKELSDRIVIRDNDDLKVKIKRRMDRAKSDKVKFYSVEEAREKLTKLARN